jgi:hypothetical protein
MPAKLLAAIVVGLLAAPLRADDAKLAAHWDDLASTNEAVSARALFRLAATPKESVAFLAKNLAPLKADPATLKRLLAKLDDDDFETRQAASREIEYLGKYARRPLEKFLEGDPGPEVKQRVKDILAKLPDERRTDTPFDNVRSISTRNVNGKVSIAINGKEIDFAALSKPAPGPSPLIARATRAVALLEHIGTAEAKALLRRMADGEADAPPTAAAKKALARLDAE